MMISAEGGAVNLHPIDPSEEPGFSPPLPRLTSFRRLADRAAARGDGTRVSVYLRRLRKHERRLQYLLSELRELLVILSGEMPLHPSPFDLVLVLQRAVDEAASACRDH